MRSHNPLESFLCIWMHIGCTAKKEKSQCEERFMNMICCYVTLCNKLFLWLCMNIVIVDSLSCKNDTIYSQISHWVLKKVKHMCQFVFAYYVVLCSAQHVKYCMATVVTQLNTFTLKTGDGWTGKASSYLSLPLNYKGRSISHSWYRCLSLFGFKVLTCTFSALTIW